MRGCCVRVFTRDLVEVVKDDYNVPLCLISICFGAVALYPLFVFNERAANRIRLCLVVSFLYPRVFDARSCRDIDALLRIAVASLRVSRDMDHHLIPLRLPIVGRRFAPYQWWERYPRVYHGQVRVANFAGVSHEEYRAPFGALPKCKRDEGHGRGTCGGGHLRWCAAISVVYVGEVEGAVTVKWAMTWTALKVLLSAVRSTTTDPNMLIVPPIVIPGGSDALVLGADLPADATADVNAVMVTTPAPGVDGPLS